MAQSSWYTVTLVKVVLQSRGERSRGNNGSGEMMLNSPNSKIRILYITDTLTSGGKERQLVELLRASNNIGEIRNELAILSNVIHYNEVWSFGINIHVLERTLKWDFSVFEKLFRVVRQYQPHIIFSWESMCSMYA